MKPAPRRAAGRALAGVTASEAAHIPRNAADSAAPARAAAVASTAAVLAATAAVLIAVEIAAPARVPLTAEQLAYRLDLNTASRDELLLLPMVGPALADAILAHRTQAAPALAFRTPADLRRVRGFGPTRVARLSPLLRWPNADAAAALPTADASGDDVHTCPGDDTLAPEDHAP